MNTAVTLTGGKHGTKWIGGLLTAFGALSSIDPSMLPPSWLPYIALAGGLATVVRGAVNTANSSQP